MSYRKGTSNVQTLLHVQSTRKWFKNPNLVFEANMGVYSAHGTLNHTASLTFSWLLLTPLQNMLRVLRVQSVSTKKWFRSKDPLPTHRRIKKSLPFSLGDLPGGYAGEYPSHTFRLLKPPWKTRYIFPVVIDSL